MRPEKSSMNFWGMDKSPFRPNTLMKYRDEGAITRLVGINQPKCNLTLLSWPKIAHPKNTSCQKDWQKNLCSKYVCKLQPKNVKTWYWPLIESNHSYRKTCSLRWGSWGFKGIHYGTPGRVSLGRHIGINALQPGKDQVRLPFSPQMDKIFVHNTWFKIY